MKRTRETRRATTNAYKTEYDVINVPSYFYYDEMREVGDTITRDNTRKTRGGSPSLERSLARNRGSYFRKGTVPP